MQKAIIIGSGGLARELTSWTEQFFDIVGYSTLSEEEHACFNLPGEVFGDDISPSSTGAEVAILAIGVPAIKEKLFGRISSMGFRFPTLVHPSAVVASNVVMEEGAIICPLVNVSPNVRLGRCSFLNFNVGVGHEAQLDDFVQVNPGGQIGGSASIGTGTLVGSGAVVLDGVKVGSGATIASGAVVFGRVADQATMMGNPAKRMRAFER